ncbi:unnamed protein product [Cylindrotheca closterium]|uniref:guanylate cyclase n=1 Tax=Cylindrotheca closterium TaxID=2856 RepID=A0AAD2FQL6_9STRA|nr:unnamed protein product [Cylindrotheca closterium]
MHGLVYEIFEAWVIHNHDIDTWHAIKARAGCEVADNAFVTRTYYRYETWKDLVEAASQELNITSTDILESYGRYNIQYHFDNGYGALLKCQGSTLRQWLSNLNAMHDHIQRSFPGDNYCPPVFWCEDCDWVEGSILLHYTSKRGNLLVPWVVGIVSEIADRFFDVEIRMDQQALQDEDGASSTTWRITAVDAAKQFKLSPRPIVESEENHVSLDSVVTPNGCPFSRKKGMESNVIGRTSFTNRCPFRANLQNSQDEDSVMDDSANIKPESSLSLTTRDEGQVGGITMKKMREVFPFHVLVNRDFQVLQTGDILPRVLERRAEEIVGTHIGDVLEVTRPNMNGSWNWKTLKKVSDQHFFVVPASKGNRRRVAIAQIDNLQHKDANEENDIKFKAAMIQLSKDKILFSLLPEVGNVAELEKMRLTLSDLPLTTSQRDAIFLGEYVTQEAGKAHKLDKLNRKLKYEQRLSNALLYSIIPKGVAEELRKGKSVEPKFHSNVTLFFSDIVGFTQICDLVDPWDVIDMMNQLYSVMDHLVKHFNLYKVETVGDAYMCCSGLPEPSEYHAENVANFALAVSHCVQHIKSPVDGEPIQLRIGIHTGSCTSGVVGTMTPRYCLFGDMVNTTARHESTAIAGKIHCSSALFGRLKHLGKEDAQQFSFTPRGLVDMKGKGEHYTYWLNGATTDNHEANAEALECLNEETAAMLSSKKWKMRRYFRRGGLFRLGGESGSLSGGSSGGGSSSGFDEASSCRSSESSFDDFMENSSVDSNDKLLEDDIEDDIDMDNVDDGFGAIIEFSQEQLFSLNRNWDDLCWQTSLSQQELISKVYETLLSALSACVHKEGNRMEIMSVQLRGYVESIAELHSGTNAFHNFAHSAEVFLRADFLWNDRSEDETNPFALGKDPWDRFILLFAAVIHNVNHSGLKNEQLKASNHIIFQKHKNRGCYQERYSFSSAFELLEEEFPDLYEEISFGYPTFRSTLRKLVLSSNIESAQSVREIIKAIRAVNEPSTDSRSSRGASLAAILAMAEIGHYSQRFDLFLSWNHREFQEVMQAYDDGRADDPRVGWYHEQTLFFDDAVVPLVSELERILPQASYLADSAARNMATWRKSGKEWLAASLLPAAKVDSENKISSLVTANVQLLERLLFDVVMSHTAAEDNFDQKSSMAGTLSTPFDEIKMVIEMQKKIEGVQKAKEGISRPDLSPVVLSELRNLVAMIASGYQKNGFHNFLHASHVAHLANLLLSSASENGFACDPLARFSIVLSALVHDVGHTGVPNGQLAEEKPELAEKFCNKSIAEQNSIVIAWEILMTDSFRNLHKCLFESNNEQGRFRNLLVNCVMATDIFDSDLRALRKKRWEKSFPEGPSDFTCQDEEANCRATIVMEHIMQTSDVAHTMQEWNLYRLWNECLFFEMYDAFAEGRSDKDPSDGWYKGELWFFDNWVIPLATNLSECGVLNIVCQQLLRQAKNNRMKWKLEGEELCRSMLQKATRRRRHRRNEVGSVHSGKSDVSTVTLTSQIVNDVETLSKVMKKYEKKMEAACGNLIAVAYKGAPGATELKSKSSMEIREHFRKQDWYKIYSDDEFSFDGGELGSIRSTTVRSSRRPGKCQVTWDEKSSNILDHLDFAEAIVNGDDPAS